MRFGQMKLATLVLGAMLGASAAGAQERIHIFPPNLPGAANKPLNYEQSGGVFRPAQTPTASVSPSVSQNAQILFHPNDVTNFGGSVVKTAKQHLIFVNCANPTACWGNVPQFIGDLNGSLFIHVLDQYVGSTANLRYPFNSSNSVTKPLAHKTTDAVIRSIISPIAAQKGTGLGHIYHVFLKQGQDECFDSGLTQCYSPDDFSTFAFCGYHSFFTLNNQQVIYSVEPFQAVNGCQGSSSTLINNTANTLSHEIFEAFSDPNVNTNVVGQGILQGNEIGDVCAFVRFNVTLGARTYPLQLEQSNKVHSCANQ